MSQKLIPKTNSTPETRKPGYRKPLFDIHPRAALDNLCTRTSRDGWGTMFGASPLGDFSLESSLLPMFVKAANKSRKKLEEVALPVERISELPSGFFKNWFTYLTQYGAHKDKKHIPDCFGCTREGELKLTPELVSFVRERVKRACPTAFI
ncbi:hypothetical protein KJ780_00010 [Candidatus Micrarchaeota archaeon]|nr:hypothetical protein [Candidatus Micrarchaeota archaeon]